MSDKKQSKEQRKNAAAVAAFGTGKPPEPQKNKTVGGVRRQGESRDQFKNRMSGQDNSDIDAIFRGIQQTRGMVRRGMDGQILDNNALSGLDAFYAKNPHLATPELRQQQYAREAQQRYNNINQQGREAVDFLKTQQSMPKTPSSAYGTGSVEWLNGPNTAGGMMPDPITGKMVKMRDYLPEQSRVQDTKYGKMPWQVNGGQLANPMQGPSRLSGVDQIFPQPKTQVSPSGGVQDSMVGLPAPQGAPGGELFNVPEVPQRFKMPQLNELPDWVSSVGQTKPSIRPADPSSLDTVFQSPQKSSLGERELQRRAGVTRLPPAPKLSQTTFIPPGAETLTQKAVEAPYGINQGFLSYGIPQVRGVLPNLQQVGNMLSEGAAGVWDWLAGNPNTAYERLKQEEMNRALAQYLSGVQ